MRKYGLLGKKLDHSFSKSFFTDFFAKNNIEASYENIAVDDLEAWFHGGQARELSGFNVTIPYKEAVIPFLDEISEEARQIGAVNTVKNENGKLKGYNTDAFGFQQSIKPFLNNRHERVLILGTGGASKAVAYVLKQIGLNVIFASRHPEGENQFPYEAINEHMVNACKMIVNCTPVGTWPNVDEKPDFPTQYLTPDHFVADLIYNPEKTKLLQEAEAKGSIVMNGHSMLKEQALRAWEIFKGGEI